MILLGPDSVLIAGELTGGAGGGGRGDWAASLQRTVTLRVGRHQQHHAVTQKIIRLARSGRGLVTVTPPPQGHSVSASSSVPAARPRAWSLSATRRESVSSAQSYQCSGAPLRLHLQVAQVVLRNIDEYLKWLVILMNTDIC